MKKGGILVSFALLLAVLGLWRLCSGQEGGDGLEGPSARLESRGAGQGQSAEQAQGREAPRVDPRGLPVVRPSARLSTGPTWTPMNPWFKTRGIGRRTPPPAKGAVLFPDGTWLPVLNGVQNPPAYPGFNPGYPYAPVVQIDQADDGTQWYIHADGTTSSPQNVPYSEGGKPMGTRPGWAVGNPHDKKPVVGPDGRIRYETRKSGKPKLRSGPGG